MRKLMPPSHFINPPSVNIKSYTLPTERRTSAVGQKLYKVIKSPPHTALARLKSKESLWPTRATSRVTQQNLFSYILAGICTPHFVLKKIHQRGRGRRPRGGSLLDDLECFCAVQSEVGRRGGRGRVAGRHEQGVRVGRQGPCRHAGLLHVRGCEAVVAEVGVFQCVGSAQTSPRVEHQHLLQNYENLFPAHWKICW